jgi:hypothetical protein
MYALHAGVGESVKATGSYSTGVALAGLAPLLGLAVLVLLWDRAAPRVAEVKVAAGQSPAPW